MIEREIERLINPPAVGFSEGQVLCPPISSVEDYMRWITENRQQLRIWLGLEADEC
jgi:hypothetical protein